MDIKTQTINIGGQDLVLETGRFAEQAGAAVTATYGDTVVFVAVVMGRANEALGYFPLSVEYQEKLYAGGKIKGSRWVKRDGRPSDDAILKARLIDRSIRPLFPDGIFNEVQVVATVLSADGVNDADMPAMYAVSAALAMSNMPWEGPISAVRLGLTPEGELVVNPNFEVRETSQLDLIVSGTTNATVMVEAGANEVSEAKMLEAFNLAQTENARISKEIAGFAKVAGKEKVVFTPKDLDSELVDFVKTKLGKDQLNQMIKAMARLEPSGKDEFIAGLVEANDAYTRSQYAAVIDSLLKKEARRQTLEDGVRPDGRKLDEIRPISVEVGLLPRTHGSGMFKRGSTQALTICTLGSPSLNQLIENMEGEESKRYIHHYYMPPFSVGETGRVGWPSRREIGHGALAERALEPVIPSEEDFPYTIHVVSELMSSNGSTSMASVCGSTMSLMDAGVPLKKPVAGIAMGLLTDGENYVVLTDIQGLEDHTGDMDFKVAGTRDGITAMQMDIKVKGIPFDVLQKALEQARVGRLYILDKMLAVLPEPRPTLSPYAPKIETIQIPVERIGEIIGPGGKVIKAIIADSGADVDIEDDGRVFISSIDQSSIDKARRTIEGIIKEVEPGEEYEGEVSRIENFGAFVDILPGKSGLVHVSRMKAGFVKDPHDVVEIGDMVKVRVTEIDNMGRINLTMLSLEEEAEMKANQPERPNFGNRGPRRDFDRGNDRGGDRGDRFESRRRR